MHSVHEYFTNFCQHVAILYVQSDFHKKLNYGTQVHLDAMHCQQLRMQQQDSNNL